MCHALGDEDTCNGNKKCSWCDSAAVASTCHSVENAKRLPAAVFKCSNIDTQNEENDYVTKRIDHLFQ